MSGTYWSHHTHSRYSVKDALPRVVKIVDRAVELDYPALGLTDHGNMGGTVELYMSCRKAGIEPLPGIEAYVAFDRNHRTEAKTKSASRTITHHGCFLAYTPQGYRNLVTLNNLAIKNFRFTPIIDLGDLMSLASSGQLEGVAMTTGCWFGLLAKQMRDGDPRGTLNMLKALQGAFAGELYVELQHHDIHDEEHEDDLHVEMLWGLAQQIGAPILLGQDSHYVWPKERQDHETMKRLGSWSENPDDAIFPGDGYHMVGDDWMKMRYEPEVYAAGIAGHDALLAKACVRIPELETFKLSVPDVTGNGTADESLRANVELALAHLLKAGKIPASKEKAYRARIETELDVVLPAGFAGYLLFTQTVTDMMLDKGIGWNVRGSASGSLLCWLLGITSLDPIVWGLSFDRFLSRDLTKPPDIDLDVEHDRRGEVLRWLMSQYHVVNIGNWSKLGVREDEYGENKGSLLVLYKTWANKMGHSPVPGPRALAAIEQVGKHEAYKSYGVHASGLLISSDETEAGELPFCYVASSKTLVTAYDMKSIDSMGRLKLDVLGLRTMTALRTWQEATGIKKEEIPLNDPLVYRGMSKGQTVGLFQLDGWSARKGVKEMKPKNIGDVIAAMALFRPAAQKSGATRTYLDRRLGKVKTPTMHPILARATKATYGVIIYQEQVLEILADLGLSVEDADLAKKSIKASNANVVQAKVDLERIIGTIRAKGEAAGFDEADQAVLSEALLAYADYGFNLAHATAYGVLAYISGWYRFHHPIAFWAGMLQAYDDEDKKLPGFLRETRSDGVVILPPHVNSSQMTYSIDPGGLGIRKGFVAIEGIGVTVARELFRHRPYAKVSDLAKCAAGRVSGNKYLGLGYGFEQCGGTVLALAKAGALRGLPYPENEHHQAVKAAREAMTVIKDGETKKATKRRICWPDPTAECLMGVCEKCPDAPFRAFTTIETYVATADVGSLWTAIEAWRRGLETNFDDKVEVR